VYAERFVVIWLAVRLGVGTLSFEVFEGSFLFLVHSQPVSLLGRREGVWRILGVFLDEVS